MSRSRRKPRQPIGKQRRISVRAVRRESLDTERLSRALLSHALQQAAEEAAAEADARRQKDTPGA